MTPIIEWDQEREESLKAKLNALGYPLGPGDRLIPLAIAPQVEPRFYWIESARSHGATLVDREEIQ